MADLNPETQKLLKMTNEEVEKEVKTVTDLFVLEEAFQQENRKGAKDAIASRIAELETVSNAKPEPETAPVAQEAVYSKDEVLSASRSFGVSVDLMAGALRLAEKDELTRPEIEQAIKNFKEKEV